MQADIHILFQTEDYIIKNFLCQCGHCQVSEIEYQDVFSICFIRKGNFLFQAFRNNLDACNGYCLLNKPGFEYRVGHFHSVPDQCTIISFTPKFFEELEEKYRHQLYGFLQNPDIPSLLVKNKISIDYLHEVIFRKVKNKNSCRLEIETLIFQTMDEIFHPEHTWINLSIRTNEKQYLGKIELARHFILTNFTEDIALSEVAHYCGMSVFHFARVFKSCTSYTPHEYLLGIRMHHAEKLLITTDLPVQDISFKAGFGNPDYFSTAFKKRFSITPRQFRTANI